MSRGLLRLIMVREWLLVFWCQGRLFDVFVFNLKQLSGSLSQVVAHIWRNWNLWHKVFFVLFRHFRKWDLACVTSQGWVVSGGVETLGLIRCFTIERLQLSFLLFDSLFFTTYKHRNLFNFGAAHTCDRLRDLVLGLRLRCAIVPSHYFAKLSTLTLWRRSWLGLAARAAVTFWVTLFRKKLISLRLWLHRFLILIYAHRWSYLAIQIWLIQDGTSSLACCQFVYWRKVHL